MVKGINIKISQASHCFLGTKINMNKGRKNENENIKLFNFISNP